MKTFLVSIVFTVVTWLLKIAQPFIHLLQSDTFRHPSSFKMFLLFQDDSDSYQAIEDSEEITLNQLFIVLTIAATLTIISLTYHLLVRFAHLTPNAPKKANWTSELFKGQFRRKASKAASLVGSCNYASDPYSTATGGTVSKPETLPKPQASPSSAASYGSKLLWVVPGGKSAPKKVQKMAAKVQLSSNRSTDAATKNENIERILSKDKYQFREVKLNPKEFGYFQPESSPKKGGQSPVKETKEQSVEGSGSFASVFSPGEPSLTNSSVKTAPILGVPIADDKSSNSNSDNFMLDLKSH